MAVRLGGNVLVTGANRGIGLELVRQLAHNSEPSDRIFAGCRHPDGPRAQALTELAQMFPQLITIVKLDVSDPACISEAVEFVGFKLASNGLNLLINNAAVNIPAKPATLASTGVEEMMESFKVNVVGPFLLTKELLPLLQRAAGQRSGQGGSQGMSCARSAVINVSTFLSSIEKCPETFSRAQMYPYRTSKAALNMLTRCLAADQREQGILVTAIHPGWVLTDMGGAEAPLPPQDSVRGMLSVMSSLDDRHSGALLDWCGNGIPW
ncbi:C-signal-like [Aplochiton taeniatus]